MISRDELTMWAIQHGWKLDRWGHLKKEFDNGTHRLKLSRIAARHEIATPFGCYAEFGIEPAMPNAGLCRTRWPTACKPWSSGSRIRHSPGFSCHSFEEGEALIEKFFDFSRTIDRMRQGPLGAHVDTFAAMLVEQGFPRLTGRFQIRVVADFSRWIESRRIAVAAIDENVIARYGADYRRKYAYWSHRPPILRRFLEMLGGLGVAQTAAPFVIATPAQQEVRVFLQYLRQERGLSERTIPNIVTWADRFLCDRFPNGRPSFSTLGPLDVTRFVERQAARLKSGSAKIMVAALRTYLRYLRHRGDLQTDLASAIPSVPPYSVSKLPTFLPAGAVAKILDGCDRLSAQGRRDYAVLLLLARLGLRSGELIGMRLEDIDWDLAEITIRGKGGRDSKLPLPSDVGEAVADYLRHDRPVRVSRCLFLTLNAPVAGLTRHGIRCVVRSAMDRAGVDSPHKGPHILRHSLATEMLRKGASLDEIGEVLRHRSPKTTGVYAKVDINALQELALPWPGGAK